MHRHLNKVATFFLIIMILFASTTFILAIDPLKSFIPFSGDLTVAYTASTIQYNDTIKINTSILEEPPPTLCIGSGGPPCVCTNCKCCTSDCPACKASPVITGGAYERRDTDFTIQGRGFPFDFTRYYYSSGRSIGSLGLAWASILDVSLIMVGQTRAYFQTERETIEFSGSDSSDCTEISYGIPDKSKNMIISGIVLADNECYYKLTDYDSERIYIFYKDAKFNGQYDMKGQLKKECDYYSNCWEFEYHDLTGSGRIAVHYVKNYSGTTFNNAYAEFSYLPLEFPYPGQTESPYLLSEIHSYESGDTAGRIWQYLYETELVNYAESAYTFIGAQGVYPRLRYVEVPNVQTAIWRYDYFHRTTYDSNHIARSGLLEHVYDRTGRPVADIAYYSTDNLSPIDARLSRVRTVTNEEGTLTYDYSNCGEYSNIGFCKTITKNVNSAIYTIVIDEMTGFIKKITNPGNTSQYPDQQYCYYSNKKIGYYKELFDIQNNVPDYHYTRYEYDTATGALNTLVRNACPFDEATCLPIHNPGDNCTDYELTWQYEYELDNGIPVKIKTITAPPDYQSWKYEYYKNDPSGNPDWTLHYIYRQDATQPNVFQEVSEFIYYSDGLVHESKDALDKATTYSYYNDTGDTVRNGKVKSMQYPANNDDNYRPAYNYSYCHNCYDHGNPASIHYSGEAITDPAGKQTYYYYDQMERLERIELPDPGNGATGFVTTYAYDILPGDGTICTDTRDANDIVNRSCYDRFNDFIKQIQDYNTQPNHAKT
jgi:Domain of unknown function (DUF6531)